MSITREYSVEIESAEKVSGHAHPSAKASDVEAFFSHPTADKSPTAIIGEDTRIWHQAQVREGARIGSECIIGKGVYIDFDVVIGNRVKIQNYASVYHGAMIEDGVFIGPYVCLTNDKRPRAIDAMGKLKGESDWEVGHTRVRYGASIGAGAIILPGVTIGRFALVGAGALVTKDVPSYGLVVGAPAVLEGYVCQCGYRLVKDSGDSWFCPVCLTGYELQEIPK
jgi:acetyltransferase-like isoleucine patch superfamily enzyme